MTPSIPDVSYAESLGITATHAIRFVCAQWPNLVPANTAGLAGFNPEQNAYGFLIDHEKPISRWHAILRGTPSRKFVGILWFSEKTRQATHKRWVIEVYGRQYVDLLTKVAEALSKEFKVEIHIRLETEFVGTEKFPDVGF